MSWMNADRLEVIVMGQAPTMTIELRGELTSTNGSSVLATYHQAATEGVVNVIVDFARVDLMNSAGISQLIGIVTDAHRARRQVIFTGLSAHYRKILTMMGLTRYAVVYDTVADAQKSLAASG
jgi:anti-anti-sigma factor